METKQIANKVDINDEVVQAIDSKLNDLLEFTSNIGESALEKAKEEMNLALKKNNVENDDQVFI